MASSKQVVGNPTPRVEGELKVSGHAKYAVDITLPGMLWGKLLRSPLASAKIMKTLVFGVSASDPLTLAAVAATLALVALMASLVPAYRALRLDPVKVLRAD